MGIYATQVLLNLKIIKFKDYAGKEFEITLSNKV